jgi:hypothetical protein
MSSGDGQMMAPVAQATRARYVYLRTVRCPGCGRLRELTDRHVRKGRCEATLCNLCRFPARKLPPTIADRRFWLSNYADEEIALMAEAIFGRRANRASISAWRIRLNVASP